MSSIYDINYTNIWAEYTYYITHKIVYVDPYYYYCTVDHVSTDSFTSDLNYYWDGMTVFNEKTKPKFLWRANYGSSIQNDPKIKKIQYGDSYSQRVPDGINNNLIVLDLNFDQLKVIQARAILHFLDQRKGSESFVFTPPEPFDKPKLFVCESWSTPINFYDNISIKCRFTEVPA